MVTLQRTSTVKVHSELHGLFTIDGDKFAHRLELFVNNVNWDSKARRAMCALISQATDINYFDADLVLIVAASIECGFDDFTCNYTIADSDDELWVAEIYKRVSLGDY